MKAQIKTASVKHTPGPWKIAEHFNEPCTVYFERGEDDEPGICTTDGSEFTPVDSEKEQIANARLIAAAPDMLDSLKGLLYELRQHFPGIETPVSSAAGLKAEYLAAAEAITRVEGD